MVNMCGVSCVELGKIFCAVEQASSETNRDFSLRKVL